jgi:hypothetical protein
MIAPLVECIRRLGIPAELWVWFGAVGLLLIADWLRRRTDRRISDFQSRQRLYGELAGFRRLIPQLHYSAGEADIYLKCLKWRWNHLNDNSDAFDSPEVVRTRGEFREFSVKLIEAQQELSVSVAQLRCVMPTSPKLLELTERVFLAHQLEIGEPPDEVRTEADLGTWSTAVRKQLSEHVEQTFGQPIQELIEHLRPFTERRWWSWKF